MVDVDTFCLGAVFSSCSSCLTIYGKLYS